MVEDSQMWNLRFLCHFTALRTVEIPVSGYMYVADEPGLGQSSGIWGIYMKTILLFPTYHKLRKAHEDCYMCY